MKNIKKIIKQDSNRTPQKASEQFVYNGKILNETTLQDTLGKQKIDKVITEFTQIAPKQNYWPALINASSSASNKSQNEDLMIMESVFLNTFRNIINESVESNVNETLTNNNKETNSSNSNDKAITLKEGQDKSDDLIDNPGNLQEEDGNVVLVVNSRNSFSFLDKKSGKRIESQESLKALDSYLQTAQGKNILKSVKQNIKNTNRKNMFQSIQEGSKIALDIFKQTKLYRRKNIQLSIDTLVSEVQSFSNNYSKVWQSATNKTYFGDGIDDKKTYQKDYFALVAYLMMFYSFKYARTEQNSGSDSSSSSDLSEENIDNMIQRITAKINGAGKDPTDKTYLRQLLKKNGYKNPMYKKALEKMING